MVGCKQNSPLRTRFKLISGLTWSSVDGNTYGNCIVFPDGDYNCNSIFGGKEQHHGYRKFRCLTRFTADQINHGQ